MSFYPVRLYKPYQPSNLDWKYPKAAFHFRVFHTHVYARKTLNILKPALVVEQPHDLM